MRQTVKHPQPHPAHSNGSKWSEFFVPNRSGRKAPTKRTYKSILQKKTNQFYIPINRTLIGRHQPLRTSALMGPAGQDKKPNCFLIRQPVCAVVTATMGLGAFQAGFILLGQRWRRRQRIDRTVTTNLHVEVGLGRLDTKPNKKKKSPPRTIERMKDTKKMLTFNCATGILD